MFNSYSAAEDIVTNNENGILIKPFNVIEYVDATIDLINNPSKLKKLSLNAYESVNNFSYDETYKKWDAVFNNAEIKETI
jgi:glycosyltransferase involved in cell wall biosynthesis